MQSLSDPTRRHPGLPPLRRTRRPIPRWVPAVRVAAPMRPDRWRVILPPHPVLH